jgi:hypothetical protein
MSVFTPSRKFQEKKAREKKSAVMAALSTILPD